MNTRHVARITRLTLLLLAWLSVAVSASGQPIDPAQQQTGDRANDSPLRACEPRPGSASQAIRILEIRSMGRIEEDLALVDGINANRDVLIVACRELIWPRFKDLSPKGVLVQVRAWRKPADGGWLEMRLNEPPQDEAMQKLQDARRYGLQEVSLRVNGSTAQDPRLVVPLRRELVKPTDLVRIRIRIAPESTIHPTDASPGQNATGEKAGTADPQDAPGVIVDNEDVIDSIFEVGRFGLHIRFSDMALFVQRLGEDRANSRGNSPVLFDSVNFRPAPGVNYGFNYYHRRHASIRVLEPGFGVHMVFLNWNERPRNAASADTDVTQATNLQIGMGLTGSMFDGTVVGALGWNLHVKDHRPYIGIGFSIAGLARKISEFVRD
jgi:hypothetical protein